MVDRYLEDGIIEGKDLMMMPMSRILPMRIRLLTAMKPWWPQTGAISVMTRHV